MTPEELKKLEAEHKKAMEGINAVNKKYRTIIDDLYEYIGLDKK